MVIPPSASDSPLTILLLGGRAPATLELARAFHGAGYRVISAESAPVSLTDASRAVARSYRLPPPARAIDAFGDALTSIIQRESVTFLLPTCEEIFHVARIRARLPESCRVFVPPLPRLHAVHHKAQFVDLARTMNLPVPESHLVSTRAALTPFIRDSRAWVFKPAYSRFAAQTLIRPAPSAVAQALTPTSAQPWVAQRYVAGRQICTYSVAHDGRLTAHSAYPTEWTAGQGAAVAFRAIEHAASRAWVAQFVAAANWTGQIAFDFIEHDGTVTAIECNPRATSGIHLLASHPHFARAYFDAKITCVTPAPGASAMVGAGMVVYGLPTVRTRARWRAWRAMMQSSRDVLWRTGDPQPWFHQWGALAAFVVRAARLGITPLQASTWDIEWNGEA